MLVSQPGGREWPGLALSLGQVCQMHRRSRTGTGERRRSLCCHLLLRSPAFYWGLHHCISTAVASMYLPPFSTAQTTSHSRPCEGTALQRGLPWSHILLADFHPGRPLAQWLSSTSREDYQPFLMHLSHSSSILFVVYFFSRTTSWEQK